MPFSFFEGESTVPQRSNAVRIGAGLQLLQDGDGLPRIVSTGGGGGGGSGEAVIMPSGGDDTTAIQDALWWPAHVRLGPGQFNISAELLMGDGALLRGSGVNTTRIVKAAGFNGAAIAFGDGADPGLIENLSIVGPGRNATGSHFGIRAIRSVPTVPALRIRISNVELMAFNEAAIYLENVIQAELENISISDVAKSGVVIQGGRAHRLSTVRVRQSGLAGLSLLAASGVVADACEVDECSDVSYYLNGTSDAVLNACRADNSAKAGLHIEQGNNIVVNAFMAELTGAQNAPYLFVTGATNVMITSFGKVLPTPGNITVEADVGGAGGRVLVGAHNLDRTKITSNTKFAELSAVAL